MLDIETDIEDDEFPTKNKRRSINRKSKFKYRRHLKELAAIGGYPCGATFIDEEYVKGVGYVELEKPYYKRLYRSHCSKYFKNIGNRQVRRYKNKISNNSGYKRIYDYWWAIC